MTQVFAAIVPGWRGRPVVLPLRGRAALQASFLLAHCLAWLWFRRPLSGVASPLLQRMVRHQWWPLRAVVQWWKLVALVTRC